MWYRNYVPEKHTRYRVLAKFTGEERWKDLRRRPVVHGLHDEVERTDDHRRGDGASDRACHPAERKWVSDREHRFHLERFKLARALA